MRRLLPGETAFGYLMLAFSLFLLYQTYRIAGFSSISSGGAYPMFAAALMVISSLVVVLRNRRSPKVEATGPAGEWHRFRHEVAPPYPLIGYIGIMVLYMLLMEPLGFNLSSFLFLFGSFAYLYRRGICWRWAEPRFRDRHLRRLPLVFASSCRKPNGWTGLPRTGRLRWNSRLPTS